MRTIRDYPRGQTSRMRTIRDYPRGQTRAELSQYSPCRNCGKAIGPGEPFAVEEDELHQEQVRHSTRLYFDESAREVRDTLLNMGFCVAPTMPEKTPDVEWLIKAGEQELTVFTHDSRIARNLEERQAVIDNRVKCYILPSRTKNAWDKVRGFVSMWHKIEAESAFPGPFIWKFHDETAMARWEQLYPESKEYSPTDLSKVPVGHLLNLFADVVHQFDDGWWSEDFVNGLHRNIRLEIESRITGVRQYTVSENPKRQLLLSIENLASQDEWDVPLSSPANLQGMKMLIFSVTVDDEASGREHIWIIPAHKANRFVKSPPDDPYEREGAYKLVWGSNRFCRSGFGLR